MKRSPTVFIALCLATLLLSPARALQAQTQAQLAAAHAGDVPAGHAAAATIAGPPRHILPPRAADGMDGSRVVITADAPLDGYNTYQENDRFYVAIPRAELAAAASPLSGRGFTDARVERDRAGVLLSFRLQAAAQARVSQKFNRLEITFTPALPEAWAQGQGAQQDAAQKPVAAGDDHELIRQLLRRIEELEGQVKELRETRGETAAVTHAAAQPQATPETNEQEQAQALLTEHEHETAAGPHLQIQGFADADFRASNERGTTNRFALGQLDLFITSKLSEKFSVLSELIIAARPDNSFDFEIHRLLLRYAPNDYFNLSIGRYHTAIGYYNTAYHHGAWFQTAADRPFLFAFEGQGGPLPLHNVGLSATGRIPSGGAGLRYIAEVGNGRSARAAADRAVQTAFDENNGKSFNLGLLARPDAVPGLQAGFSFYHDHLTPNVAPNVSQSIMAAHLIYRNPRYELLNEAIVFRHSPDGAQQVFYTPGFYTQFARRFGKTTPYFRYQYVNAAASDPVLGAVGRRNGPAVGLRFDVTDYAAVKAQYNRTARRSHRPLDEMIMQFAFTF